MKKFFISMFTLFATALFATNVCAESIKLAIIAPEGSAWSNIMNEMGKELKEKTQGRWDLKLYAGGVAGDEKVVLKKMQIGQIDAAGFTGVGLGEIYPSIRVLELPFLFDNSKQVDLVVQKLMPDIKAGFAAKGYEFLGWAEAGFVHIFSNKPILKLADMKGVKMWLWEGDPLASKLYQSLSIVPVPLAIPDVLMALQTKMIEGVYAPPLGAIAMQWFSKTKYMSDANLVNSIGALLITKKVYDKMTPQDQAILKEVSDKYCKKLVASTRSDNIKAVETLKASGIQIVKVEGPALTELVEKSKGVWSSLVGTLYSKELLDKVMMYVEEAKKQS